MDTPRNRSRKLVPRNGTETEPERNRHPVNGPLMRGMSPKARALEKFIRLRDQRVGTAAGRLARSPWLNR